MTAFSALSRMALQGQTVWIRTNEEETGSTSHHGVIYEILADGIILESSSDTEYIASEKIVDWRISKNNSEDDLKLTSGIPNSSSQEKNQFSSKQITSEVPINPSVVDEFELLFTGEPELAHPLPTFNIPNITPGLRKEIDRWRNRYDYAQKIHEPARISQDVANVIELAESLGLSELYLLAGSFAFISGLESSRSKLYYKSAVERGSCQASIALASMNIQEKNWDEAADSLITALLCSDQNEYSVTLARLLGQCILRSSEKRMPGLGNLLASDLIPPAQHLVTRLTAMVAKDHLEMHQAILQRDIDKLRNTDFGQVLFRAERKIIQPTSMPSTILLEKEKASRRGRVSSFYVDRGFGFIVEDTTGQTWFFYQAAIEDDLLLSNLLEGDIRQNIKFSGSPETSHGKYPQAKDLKFLATDLSSSVGHKGRPPLKIRVAGIPKDGGTYSHAKASEQLGQLDKAEQLFREEIENNGPYYKSAIKDLATLLNRKGMIDPAINILNKNRNHYLGAELISLDQMSIQFLVNAKRFVEAAGILDRLVNSEKRHPKQMEWQRQEAYCYYAAGEFENALKILYSLIKLHPGDNASLLLLEKVKREKDAGIIIDDKKLTKESSEGEESLASLALGLSTIARRQLDNCELRGIDSRVKESNKYTEKDFQQVKNFYERLRGRKPRERAEYLLTLASLSEKASLANQDNDLLFYLRKHFISLAEATLSERVPVDVVRCYAVESLILCPNNFKSSSWSSIESAWELVLGTYISTVQETDSDQSERLESGDRFKLLLKKFNDEPNDWKHFLIDAPSYKLRAPTAFMELEKHLVKTSLPFSISTEDEKIHLRDKNAAFHSISSISLSVDRLSLARETLAELVQFTRFDLDKRRLLDAVKLFGDSREYILERHFRELETRFLRLEVEIKTLVDDIMGYPTHLSIEKLLPIMATLLTALQQDFERACLAKPVLEIRNVLDNDFYGIDEGRVALRLLIISKDESSPPVEAIDLLLNNGDGMPCHSPEPLHGGQSREIELTINPSTDQITDGAFTVNITIQYRNRTGQMEIIEPQSLAVRLSNVVFAEIPNPYSRYSGGSPVEEDSMFFGRNLLVDQIVNHLSNGSLGQCFVLYGQKRSGKSSVLKQVEKKLTQNDLIASLSAGTFDPSNLWKSFARLLGQELEFRLEDKGNSIPEKWPSMIEIESQPIESIRIISRILQSLNYRLIVAIDEFTYIYEKNQAGVEDFMRGWKALLEAKTFNALLIGQDTMPRFKQAYPNEFGITHDKRISYLSFEETSQLASQPIRLEGESRFRGQALKKLFNLTAGSPFFLQIVCDRLVRHLNERHAPFVTEADIDQVRQQLTLSVDALPPERFDPLVSAAGEKVALISRDDLWNILAKVARQSLHSDWCYRNALVDIPKANEAIKDLVDREILASEGDRVSIRVGLFAAWLRANQ